MAKRPTKKAAGSTRRRNNRPQTPFPFKLLLNQWLLSLFNVTKFEELAEHLRNEALEGLDENNVHRFQGKHACCRHGFCYTRKRAISRLIRPPVADFVRSLAIVARYGQNSHEFCYAVWASFARADE